MNLSRSECHSGWHGHLRDHTCQKHRSRLVYAGVGSWPLINRELRVLSRHGQLFWIRVIGGGAGFATLAFILLQHVAFGATLGGRLFAALNVILFLTIVFIGPIVTADCVAQEKREGTLGLLFLAPITGRGIIVGKLAVNAVRAFTLLLAVVPMMALPVVFGGVSGPGLAWALALQLTALSIALAAGILASTLHRNFIHAAIMGEFYAMGLTLVCGFLLWVSPFIACFVGLMAAWILVDYCGTHLKKIWERDSADFQAPRWSRRLAASPVARAVFHWNTRQARSVNPIAWLQEYSWTARLAKWGWFALVLVVEFFLIAVTPTQSSGTKGQEALALVLMVGLALTGANSFRQERLNGAMELLLVTPLSPARIAFGRLWGIWVHFFPAFLVVGLLWGTSGLLTNVSAKETWLIASSFLFLPAVGLYVSLLPWNIIMAWAVVFLSGAALPIYAGELLFELPDARGIGLTVLLQALAGGASLIILQRKLRRRAFPFV